MRRFLMGLVLLVAAILVLPPLWFAVFPPDSPELPEAGRRVTVGSGLAVNAIERGIGPPVVMVHGLPGSAYDWVPLIDALAARGRRAIAYDRVGYGRSDGRGPDAEFTAEANARDLAGLLESEDLRDVTLAGWSFGGPIVIRAAHLASDRVGRLVLIGTGGPSSDDDAPPDPGMLFRPIMTWIGWVPPIGRAMMTANSASAFSDGPAPDWWIPQLRANFAMPHTRKTYREEIASIAQSPALDLEQLEQPILLIHGDDDRLAPLAIGEYLHGRAPSSELVVVKNGSHMLPITHSEQLAERIVVFATAR